MWIPVQYEIVNRTFFKVQVQNPEDGRLYWVDIGVDEKYHDIDADWSQYIFYNEDPEDTIRKATQEDIINFDDATGVAVCLLEEAGVIYQDEKANWFVKE